MKRISLAMVIGAGLLTVNAWAIPTLTLTVDPNLPPGTTAHVLGAINPDHPADAADETTAINGILGLALGGSGTLGGNTIYRSHNNFGALPTAVFSGTGTSGNTTSFLDTGFTYLAVKYDGPNGAAEVWYIGDIAAGTMLTVPGNAFGSDNNTYGISGYNFFNGTTTNPPPSVPDGGSTVALLGLALAGGEVLRRKMQKQ
jgi:hypothetical protein